jgi:hypothetical protein
MRLSNSGPVRGVQDRASVVATTILSTILRHLADHPELHSEITALLRDEFADVARMARDDVRENECEDQGESESIEPASEPPPLGEPDEIPF